MNIKVLGAISVYGGSGSGADAPAISLDCDYNSLNAPSLDFSDDFDEGDWDFNN